jgi:chemotaxis protein CheX
VITELAPCAHTEIAEAIRQATMEVFSTMLSIDIAAGEVTVGKTVPGRQSGVIALLGLTGERSGAGQFSCEPAFACRIASQMLMAEYEEIGEDVLDAIAEVANMIVGNIKNTLETYLGPMGLSTPNIVFGAEFDTRIAGNPDRVTVPFTSGNDTMTVQVVLAQKRVGFVAREQHHAGHLALAH